MARTQARIFTSIWHDDDFLSLTPHAQRLYFLSLSQPGLSFCGVVSYTAQRWAGLAKGSNVDDVRLFMTELAAARFVVVDETTEEVWVRSFLKHDGVLRSPNLIKAMVRDLAAVHSRFVHRAIVDYLRGLPKELHKYLPEGFPDGLPEGYADGLDEGLPEGLWNGLPEGYGEGLRIPPNRDTEGDKGFPGGSRAHSARPIPTSSSSAPTPNGSRKGSPEEEEEEDLIGQAVRQAAHRRLAKTTSVVTHPEAWLSKTAAAIYRDLPPAVLEARGLTVAQLVDMIDPPAKANTPATPLDATVAAARSKAERNELPPCPTCDTRGGDGKLLRADGMAVPCPTCSTVAAR